MPLHEELPQFPEKCELAGHVGILEDLLHFGLNGFKVSVRPSQNQFLSLAFAKSFQLQICLQLLLVELLRELLELVCRGVLIFSFFPL